MADNYWYKKTNKKSLHNIDTFYYSVKLEEDFTVESKDSAVLAVRNMIKKADLLKDGEIFNPVDHDFEVYYKAGTFARFYSFRLEAPEKFDFFFAPSVPVNVETNTSLTSEIVVQLRSRYLWENGCKLAFDESLKFVVAFCEKYNLHIQEIKENRCDFCWHTNILQNPETYLRIDNFSKMQVSRFKRVQFAYQLKSNDEYENDYIALGNRGDKCFLRMYLKTKEVVEQGYKGWFFYVWLFNGLISRYDLYCLEEAYKNRSWKYLDVARVKFALENIEEINPTDRQEMQILVDAKPFDYDRLLFFARKYTPEITKILNVEFQVMRKMTKSFQLVEFKDNAGLCKRIYDFLDNRKLITDYLTHYTFRLVAPSLDLNKSRANYVDFWRRIRATKQVDVAANKHDLKLIRDYTSKLNMEIRKTKAIKAISNVAMMMTQNPDTTLFEDAAELLSIMNDNDFRNLHNYKYHKIKDIKDDPIELTKRLSVTMIDRDTGEIL